MPALPAAYRSVILDHQAQLAKLVRSAGVGPVKRLYQGMLEELAAKLKVTQRGTFTHQQLRGMLAQVRIGIATVSRGIAGAVKDGASQVGIAAARSILTSAAKLEKHFTGAIVPMPLLEIGRLRGLVQGQVPSLMRVHDRSMARWGASLVGRMEATMASSLSLGESHTKAIDRVLEAGDMEWWQGERIVRTEMSFAANATARAANEEQADELDGDMWSRWSEHVSDDGQPMDDRVGDDSLAMNGQVAPPGGMFTQPPTTPLGELVSVSLVGKQWAFPPNRSNDRSVLVPWRAHWGVPGWTWDGGQRVPVTAERAERTNAAWMRRRSRAA